MNCFACIMVCVGVSAEQFSLGSINQLTEDLNIWGLGSRQQSLPLAIARTAAVQALRVYRKASKNAWVGFIQRIGLFLQ